VNRLCILVVLLFGCFESGTSSSGDAGASMPEIDAGPGGGPADAGGRDTGPLCPPALERCNGGDDDCDGVVDEGDLCDARGQVCEAGTCVCPDSHLCGGRCVDLENNGAHCGECGNRCALGTACGGGRCCELRGDDVDLLFVIDDSGSLSEEQTNLAQTFPYLMRALATGDVDEDGAPDFVPVESLQIGVVTTDMGTGGFRVPTCVDSDFGDDGVLRTQGDVARPGCMATYPSFLRFEPGADADDVAEDLTCVAGVGTGGCGFEQQLDAMLKAVTPSASPLTFHLGTVGHADGANRGFLRDEAMLVVVMLTDEEDCSASDPELFDPSSPRFTSDLNLRCFTHPEAIHPVSRYVEGLLATKSDPRRVLFAPIAGIPPDALGSGRPDYAAILEHPDMQERVDPTMPTRLLPSCNEPGTGLAFPPRRIVETARELEIRGARTAVGSICQSDYSDVVRRIMRSLSNELTSVCE